MAKSKPTEQPPVMQHPEVHIPLDKILSLPATIDVSLVISLTEDQVRQAIAEYLSVRVGPVLWTDVSIEGEIITEDEASISYTAIVDRTAILNPPSEPRDN